MGEKTPAVLNQERVKRFSPAKAAPAKDVLRRSALSRKNMKMPRASEFVMGQEM
jgi:hypothetical protein